MYESVGYELIQLYEMLILVFCFFRVMIDCEFPRLARHDIPIVLGSKTDRQAKGHLHLPVDYRFPNANEGNIP